MGGGTEEITMSLMLKCASMACMSVIYYIVGYQVCNTFPEHVYAVGFISGLLAMGTYTIINAIVGD